MATKDEFKDVPEAHPVQVPTNSSSDIPHDHAEEEIVKKPWWHSFKEPGSALQIIVAALLAIAIGVVVATQVDDIPEAAPILVGSCPSLDCLLYVACCDQTPRDEQRGFSSREVDCRILHHHHSHIHHAVLYHDGPRLDQTVLGGRHYPA
ncbi:hypothetical protein LB505_006376 [Fusarium chuoi]|nr:hypothetical protein LB505_006376 [Fusarium chuoi]